MKTLIIIILLALSACKAQKPNKPFWYHDTKLNIK